SRYLIRRIEETPNLEIKTRTQIVAVEGADSLEWVTWSDAEGKLTSVPVRHVFMMTGANPNTHWLEHSVALDGKGFVKTGPDLLPSVPSSSSWPPSCPPLRCDTNLPGVSDAGGVRAGGGGRTLGASREGSVCIR